jgi:heme-degrading monooxygenase HmoA
VADRRGGACMIVVTNRIPVTKGQEAVFER